MTFGEAIEAMRGNNKVRRSAWLQGYSLYIPHSKRDKIVIAMGPNIEPIESWNLTSEDYLSNDWEIEISPIQRKNKSKTWS